MTKQNKCDPESIVASLKPTLEKRYDPTELRRGIDVEMEHTDSKKVAEHIAKNHLDEFPDYYERLERMEREAKKFWDFKKGIASSLTCQSLQDLEFESDLRDPIADEMLVRLERNDCTGWEEPFLQHILFQGSIKKIVPDKLSDKNLRILNRMLDRLELKDWRGGKQAEAVGRLKRDVEASLLRK